MDTDRRTIGDGLHLYDGFATISRTPDDQLAFELVKVADRSPPMLVGESCEKIVELRAGKIMEWPEGNPYGCAIAVNKGSGDVSAFSKREVESLDSSWLPLFTIEHSGNRPSLQAYKEPVPA